jgi:CxxC-x17-CxxC domain-containing protein
MPYFLTSSPPKFIKGPLFFNNMGEFHRDSKRERKPEGRFGSRPERSFGRDSGRTSRPSFSRERDNRGSSRFGRDRDDRRPSFGRDGGRERRSGPLEMHPAVCDKCGKECLLPFKPTSSKPVFCSDCYRKNEAYPTRSSGSSFSSERSSSSPSSDDIAKINKKLDKIMKALKIE